MNTQNKIRQELSQDYRQALAQDRFGMSVAARLSDASDALPNDIFERLRIARAQAVAKRKLVAAPRTASVVVANGSSATLTYGDGDEDFSLWDRIASALPLIALLVGLVSINMVQNERRANELAEIDAALLIDDLPPAAYTDPGFVQFLKAKRDLQQ
jgi:Protein of unknown function (DUF3619)